MISYSDEARIAYSYLYRPYNDVDVFVEDNGNVAVHEILLRRILCDRVRLTRATPLRGKNEILKEARRRARDNRPAIFIVDGDFDYWTQRSSELEHNIIMLDAYCVENVVVDNAAILRIAHECAIQLPLDEVAERMQVSEYLSRLEIFFPLFIVYGIAKVLNPTLQSVGFSVHRLKAASNRGEPCPIAVRRKLRSFLVQLWSSIPRDVYLRKKLELRPVMKSLTCRKIDFISGKDYILPLLHERLRWVGRCSDTKEQLVARMASHCDNEAFGNLKRDVLSILNIQ